MEVVQELDDGDDTRAQPADPSAVQRLHTPNTQKQCKIGAFTAMTRITKSQINHFALPTPHVHAHQTELALSSTPFSRRAEMHHRL